MSQRHLGRDVSWLSAGYLSRTLGYLALTTLLARTLGPARYGELSVFLAVAAGVGYLAGSWPFLSVPILAAQGRSIGSVFRTAFSVAAGSALVSAAVMLPIGWVLLPDDLVVTGLLALYAAALIALQGLYSVFQTQGRMATIAVMQGVERLAAAALIGLLVLTLPLSPRLAEVALVASALGVTAGGFWWASRSTRLLRLKRNGEHTRRATVIRAVGWMAVVTAGSYIVGWVDLLLLASFRSAREVGIYALAYQVFTVVLQLGSLWVFAAVPAHARWAAAGEGEASSLLPERELRGATLLWAAGVALTAIASSHLLVVVFGSGFDDSLGPLMLLLASSAVLAPYFAAVAILVALRRGRELARITALGVGINVGLDLVLIPFLGPWGPAIATAVQNIAVTIAVLSLVNDRSIWRIVLPATPVVVVVGLLAAEPRDAALLVVAAVVAAGCAVGGLRILGRSVLLRQARSART